VSLAFASAYVFRGINVFQAERQGEEKWVTKPRVVWTDSTDRWSVGYSATYQVTGDNLWENVDAGLGGDQILFADYEFRPAPRLTVTPELGVYVYPWARTVPLIVEPSTELWYRGPVEVGAYVSYFYAARPGPLSEDYVYISSRVEKTLPITKQLELDFYLSAGLKLFRQQSGLGTSNDNFVDVLVVETAHYDLTSTFYVELKWAMAWTNLGTREDPVTGAPVDPGFVDEVAPYWGFTLGAEL
jgi:hypothetical protein